MDTMHAIDPDGEALLLMRSVSSSPLLLFSSSPHSRVT
jgi:hypothetical protein